MPEPTPNLPIRDVLAGHHDGPAHDRANSRRIRWWSLVWGLSYLASTWLLVVTEVEGVLGWLVAAVPIGIGVVVTAAYLRFLRDTDEFVRAAQLDGAAIGLALGTSILLGWSLLEPLGMPSPSTPVAAATMLISWAVGQFVALLRYR